MKKMIVLILAFISYNTLLYGQYDKEMLVHSLQLSEARVANAKLIKEKGIESCILSLKTAYEKEGYPNAEKMAKAEAQVMSTIASNLVGYETLPKLSIEELKSILNDSSFAANTHLLNSSAFVLYIETKDISYFRKQIEASPSMNLSFFGSVKDLSFEKLLTEVISKSQEEHMFPAYKKLQYPNYSKKSVFKIPLDIKTTKCPYSIEISLSYTSLLKAIQLHELADSHTKYLLEEYIYFYETGKAYFDGLVPRPSDVFSWLIKNSDKKFQTLFLENLLNKGRDDLFIEALSKHESPQKVVAPIIAKKQQRMNALLTYFQKKK